MEDLFPGMFKTFWDQNGVATMKNKVSVTINGFRCAKMTLFFPLFLAAILRSSFLEKPIFHFPNLRENPRLLSTVRRDCTIFNIFYVPPKVSEARNFRLLELASVQPYFWNPSRTQTRIINRKCNVSNTSGAKKNPKILEFENFISQIVQKSPKTFRFQTCFQYFIHSWPIHDDELPPNGYRIVDYQPETDSMQKVRPGAAFFLIQFSSSSPSSRLELLARRARTLQFFPTFCDRIKFRYTRGTLLGCLTEVSWKNRVSTCHRFRAGTPQISFFLFLWKLFLPLFTLYIPSIWLKLDTIVKLDEENRMIKSLILHLEPFWKYLNFFRIISLK